MRYLRSWWPPIALAALLALVPLAIGPLAASIGIVPAMTLQDRYYTPLAILFGDELFPSGPFGVYPEGNVGVAVAASAYGCMGLVIGLLLRRRRS